MVAQLRLMIDLATLQAAEWQRGVGAFAQQCPLFLQAMMNYARKQLRTATAFSETDRLVVLFVKYRWSSQDWDKSIYLAKAGTA